MEGLSRLFPAMMEACKWVYLVASEYRIPDDLHHVWFPVSTISMYELVIPGLVWLAALPQV